MTIALSILLGLLIGFAVGVWSNVRVTITTPNTEYKAVAEPISEEDIKRNKELQKQWENILKY